MACYYRAMMEELIGSLKQTHSVPLKRTDPPGVVISLFMLVYFRNEGKTEKYKSVVEKRYYLTLSNF